MILKKIIAYSTCSQLGYMFFAAGVGAYNVAMFHLFTHAFFKALLFLGSGSVIHAFKDEQNINNMGGVWKKLPYTYVLMIIGTLALTGFPIFIWILFKRCNYRICLFKRKYIRLLCCWYWYFYCLFNFNLFMETYV